VANVDEELGSLLINTMLAHGLRKFRTGINSVAIKKIKELFPKQGVCKDCKIYDPKFGYCETVKAYIMDYRRQSCSAFSCKEVFESKE